MEQAYNHHVSVMLDEVIEYANLKKNSKVLDMTLGRAGHSSEFLKKSQKDSYMELIKIKRL